MLRFTRTDWRILACAAIVAFLTITACTLALGATLAHAADTYVIPADDGLGSGTVVATAVAKPATGTPPCGQEDDPSWVWTRCGNRMRGIVTMWGTPVNVDCGTFRYLVRIGDVDTSSTPRIKGDVYCLRGVHAPKQWAS
jgi:hypothetical protein